MVNLKTVDIYSRFSSMVHLFTENSFGYVRCYFYLWKFFLSRYIFGNFFKPIYLMYVWTHTKIYWYSQFEPNIYIVYIWSGLETSLVYMKINFVIYPRYFGKRETRLILDGATRDVISLNLDWTQHDVLRHVAAFCPDNLTLRWRVNSTMVSEQIFSAAISGDKIDRHCGPSRTE